MYEVAQMFERQLWHVTKQCFTWTKLPLQHVNVNEASWIGFQTYIYFAQKCPQIAGKAISETQISKWDFKPIYFSQKYPQNAGNTVSETQISKQFRARMPQDPPTIITMTSPSLKLWLRQWAYMLAFSQIIGDPYAYKKRFYANEISQFV